MRHFWKLIFNLAGWKTDVAFAHHGLKKYIILLGPHTSNWDFVVALGYRSLLGIEKTRFLGKSQLFRPPFGWFFRWLGGIPVDRSGKHNLVDQVCGQMAAHDTFALALSPEGTRKKVDKLKTGFYFIARQARVPIIMVGFHYPAREVRVSEPLYPSADQQGDMEIILSFYRPLRGRVPEQGMMHL